jgi:hypothetical protein
MLGLTKHRRTKEFSTQSVSRYMKSIANTQITIHVQVKFPTRDLIAVSSHRDEFYEEGKAVI